MCFSSTPSYSPPATVAPQESSRQVDQAVTKARSDQLDRNRAAAGYNSTIKSGSTMGDTSTATIATKKLTGE